ncbi:THAP domain-containing protein 9 [Trachymyrmex cornetzi]|uniref:THAP domain-containing protein 9 n=1 Tax=Trachymyrmex cornetzi TaxID=471704 RepID=A0A151IRD5_9HYME|nr:THAP domain-containing protein 9 [Trachymyrmex cornetzi]
MLHFNLTIDEMSIHRDENWNGEKYVGFVDIGTDIDTDELPPAKYALVFLVTCINEHYKIPIVYYLLHSMTGAERANLLKQCLVVLHEANVHVISVTVDGAASNISMLNNMGCNLSITNLKTYFNHPISKDKIFVLLDACHMLKLIRNAFDNKKILWDKDGKIIHWKYIKLLVELQETEGLHAATKIRRRQLNFYNEKMKVSLAAQVLSTSVANALTFCEQDLQLPPFAGSSATTNFCLQINNIFDLLNGRNRFYKNKSAQCITRENYDEICKQVDNFCIYLTGLKDANEYILKSNRKMGFFGFIVDIKSILEISKSLFQDHNIKYLMTYKLSQDHVETFFSAIRSRGGFNTNPTANQFIAAYKRLLVHADVDISKSANSTIIDETVVLNISTTALTNNTGEQSIIDNLTHDYTEKQDSVIVKSDHNYYHDFHNEWLCSDYIEDVVSYIAGFIVKSITKKIKCQICLSCLTCDETLSYLQKRKCRGGLTSASKDVITTCLIGEKVFRTCDNVFHTKNIIQKLLLKAMHIIPSHVFNNDHLFDQNTLVDHRGQLLRIILTKYFNLRLYNEGLARKDIIIRIRSKYTKLIQFKNQ